MKTQTDIQIRSKYIPSGRVYVAPYEVGNYISRHEVIKILRKIERDEWNVEDVLDVLLNN